VSFHFRINRTPSDPAEAFTAVVHEAARLQLADGLSLRRARLHGAARLEVTGPADTLAELRLIGLDEEASGTGARFFVPADEDQAIQVLARLLERHPIAQDQKRPVNLLAEVSIPFANYPGLDLVGASVWRTREGGVSVTLPAQKLKTGGFYELVRGEKPALDKLKDAIAAAYTATVRTGAQTGPERA